MPFLQTLENFNLDGKQLLKLWIELGSLVRVSKHLHDLGIYNLKNHKPYNPITLSRNVWKFVLNDYKGVLKYMNEELNQKIDPDYWERLCVRMAHSYYTSMTGRRENFYAWLRANKLYDRYKEYRSPRRIHKDVLQAQMLDES